MIGRIQKIIIRALQVGGIASPQEIASWSEGVGEPVSPVALRQGLRRLLGRGAIAKVAYGRYSLSADHRICSEQSTRWAEREIREYLRSVGGIAKRSQINQAFGVNLSGNERDAQYRLITVTLAQSEIFRQDFGFGYWNLDAAEIGTLPLTGYWATFRLLERDGSPEAVKCAAAYCRAVGQAFAQARNCFIEEVVQDCQIREVLGEMGARCPALLSRFRSANAGLDQTSEYGEFPYADLYAAFESGHVGLHCATPVAFYRLCALAFGVDAALLSRGSCDLDKVIPKALLLDGVG